MSVVVNITTPTKWRAKAFFAWRKSRAFGIVLAFSPTMLSFGGELIVGNAKGFALIAGPLWLGFAALRIEEQPA